MMIKRRETGTKFRNVPPSGLNGVVPGITLYRKFWLNSHEKRIWKSAPKISLRFRTQ
jgi:hypothetical protein